MTTAFTEDAFTEDAFTVIPLDAGFTSDGFTSDAFTVDSIQQLISDAINISEFQKVEKSTQIIQVFSNGESLILDNNFKISQAFLGSSLQMVGKTITLSNNTSLTEYVARIFPKDVLDAFDIAETVAKIKNKFVNALMSIDKIFALPNSDISNAGQWVDSETGNNNGDLYDDLDEEVPDDYESAVSLLKTPVSTDTFEVKLATISDPNQSHGHKIKIRGRGDGDTKVRGILLEGATVIAVTPWHKLSHDYDFFEYELTEEEADSITDYTDLRIRIEPELK